MRTNTPDLAIRRLSGMRVGNPKIGRRYLNKRDVAGWGEFRLPRVEIYQVQIMFTRLSL